LIAGRSRNLLEASPFLQGAPNSILGEIEGRHYWPARLPALLRENSIPNCNRFASDFHRDTFYVRQIAPAVTQGDVARSKFYGGG
jgi:hypothetical protein